MSKISMTQARKKLATLWFIGGGIVFAVLFIQTITGFYEPKTNDVWNWMLPNVMPTLSLVVAVLAADSMGKTARITKIDAFMYRLALALSGVYLMVIAVILLIGRWSAQPPLELMAGSNIWLGPVQGVVSAALAVFFVTGKVEG